jgi:AcrR family transcriptional regulator
VAPGTLYSYLGGKESIVLAVAKEVCRRDAALFASLTPENGRHSGGLRDRRDSGSHEQFESLLLSAPEARLRIELWIEAMRDPELGKIVRGWLEEGIEAIRRDLETGDCKEDLGGETRRAVSLFLGSILCAALLDGACE